MWAERFFSEFNIADFFIAAFTGVLAWSTIGLWRATDRLSEDAARQFNAAFRPRLRVRHVGRLSLRAGEGAHVIVIIANVGETPATIYQMGFNALMRDQGAPFTTQNIAQPTDREPLIVGAGMEVQVRFDGSFVLSAADVQTAEAISIFGMRTAMNQLCATGTINYRDGNGAIRSTGFVRAYRHSGRRFYPVDADDAEADREYQD
jgi:hypothetical protein